MSNALAQRAAALARSRGTGVLATLLERLPGHPFASLVSYATDAAGNPIFLFSRLAVHTRNLAADPRASLLVFAPEGDSDPLAAPRLTLIGDVRPARDFEVREVKPVYLARHPEAAEYLEFGDFAFYRLEPREVYYVGGFGEMGWIAPSEYARR